jgi:hypothetical protein
MTIIQVTSHVTAPPNPWLVSAHELRDKVGSPDALFISPGHPLDFYIAYFTRRDIVSVNLIRYGTNGNVDELQRRITERAAQYRAIGAPVYVYGLESLSADQRRDLAKLVSGHLRVTWQHDDLTIYQVSP